MCDVSQFELIKGKVVGSVGGKITAWCATKLLNFHLILFASMTLAIMPKRLKFAKI